MQKDEQQDLLDLNKIMQAFGVEEWTNLGQIHSPHGERLQILTEIQGQRYLLQECSETPVGQDSAHRYDFRHYLAGQGIPIAQLWQTPQGAYSVTFEDDSFELQEVAEGELFDSSDAREQSWIASAGEILGHIHQTSRRYTGPDYRWPSEVQAGGLTQGWLNFARGKAEQHEVYAIAAALSNLVEAWERALPAAMMAIGTGRNLPEFHIHGDYSALNLRFVGNRVSEVLGLEASRWEKRLLEVAYGVFYFAGLEWSREGYLARPLVMRGLDPTRASLFLSKYSSIFPPVAGEAALLVDALTLVAPIITVNGPLEDIFYADEQTEEIPIEDILERLAWATALPSWLLKVRRSFAEMW
ncbi:MAG TPA: phosphotransferase [Ktedonobacteraceae bacterium]|nr:phosphotransferase [Ktedonobacteraceae bacterium]